MAVRRVNGRWVVEFMQSGHRIFKRLPEEATRQDATAYETKLRREIFDQATLGKRPNVSIESAIDSWLAEAVTGRKSEKGTRSHAGRVKACKATAGGITESGLLGVSEELRRPMGRVLSNATINRRLCILKAVAKFAWRKGWTEENLSARIQLLPENNARSRNISKAEIESLMAACEDRETKAFVAFAAYAGMRQGEVMALRAENVSGGNIAITDSKSGQPRVVPVVPALQPFLSEIPLRSHKRTLYSRFESARDSVGLEGLVYHDLRRSTATILANAVPPTPLSVVAHILGHKSLTTTRKVYAMIEDKTAKDALNRAFPHHNPITPYEVNEDK